ncbi:MAG: type II toxin-antitoxin system Phd/YefM family antitoxin [Chthoniobacterales bacterium]
MIQTNISNAKSNLSSYLERVKGGEEVVIADRNQPVAKLVPYRPGRIGGSGWSARLAELARRGEVRLAGNLDEPLELIPARAPEGGAKVVAALLEERRQGR